MTATFDLADPRVRAILGGMEVRRSCVQLAGDKPGPEGQPGQFASSSTPKQEVVVVYKDTFLTVDVYAIPGEPLKLHLVCPGCQKLLTVRGDRKAIDFEASAPNPVRQSAHASGVPELMAVAGVGRLSIEAFQCTWEVGKDKHAAGQVHTGAKLCKQRLVIDNNRARDA